MKPHFSLPTRLMAVLKRSHRGQALTEVALITPILLLLVGGVGDIGRAFYYKIAAENVAREAAHWATLSIGALPPNSPPTDAEIYNKVASPSQESFGISLQTAPACVGNPAPPLSPRFVANPACAPALPAGQSWLFIYPQAGSGGRTAVLPAGAHWSLVASNSQFVQDRPPDQGGVADVLRRVAGGLAPVTAEAAAGCSTWGSPTSTPASFTTGNTPLYTETVLVTVPTTNNPDPSDNLINLQMVAPAGVALQQKWASTGTNVGSIDPHGNQSSVTDTVQLTVTTTPTSPPPPNSYTFTIEASSVSRNRNSCAQTPELGTHVWNIPAAPSPSPSATASPSPVPTPSPTATPPPPSPPPTGGNNPNGAQITCTVIYYFTPVTPLVFSAANAIYIVGTATLQATY